MKLTLEAINQTIAVLFFVCYAYQFVYIPVALLRRRKRLPAAAPHRFAVLIAARNEETVIGDLLDSLHAQDYDMSLITVLALLITAPTVLRPLPVKRARWSIPGRISRR